MRTCALPLTLALLATGCNLPLTSEPEIPAGVVFVSDEAVYHEHDMATITLRNESDEDVGYNLCFSARELRTPLGWRRMESLRLCTAELRVIRAGVEAQMQEPITSEWMPGQYRMVTTIEVMPRGSRHEIFTPPFEVRP